MRRRIWRSQMLEPPLDQKKKDNNSQPASKRKIRSTRTHDSADHSSDSTIVENILSTDFIG
jgi:hypothetical protein